MKAFVRNHRDGLAFAGALLLPVAGAAVLAQFRGAIPHTDAALILVAVVVAVAADGNRLAGLLAALGTAAWFDFFLTAPYESFRITGGGQLQTALLLLGVGAAVSELAAWGRRHRVLALTDATYLATVHSTAELAAGGAQADDLARLVAAQIKALLGLRRCHYEHGTFLGHPPRLEPDGTVTVDGRPWDVAAHGLPKGEIELLVRADGHAYGRFMLTASRSTVPDRGARQVAVVLADQAGAAMGRRTVPVG